MTSVEKLIAKYEKQWNKYGMGSVISYSQVVSDLKKLKKKEAEQIVEAWYSAYGGDAHHSGEAYYNETFKSE